MELIIEVDRGVVAGVYTDSAQDVNVYIKDSDDKYNADCYAEYSALQEMIRGGGFRDVLHITAAVGLPSKN